MTVTTGYGSSTYGSGLYGRSGDGSNIVYETHPDLTIYENALYSHLKRRRRRRW